MNIFFIDKNPFIAANAMSDKHIIKMIVESAQMLSTAHRVLDGKPYTITGPTGRKTTRYDHPIYDDRLYQVAYINHPCNVWVRQNEDHYKWLYSHFSELCFEYKRRFKRIHKTDLDLYVRLSFTPNNIKKGKFTPPPQAMPDIYKHEDTITAYKNYYTSEKLFTDNDKYRFEKVLREQKIKIFGFDPVETRA
jgi:hypothetical protein